MLLVVLQAEAQNVTNSPYSRYGLGDISYSGNGHNIAMGGTFVAESTPYFINTVNPAANTNFLMQRFVFEVGFDVKYTNTQSSTLSQKNTNSTFKYLAGGFAAKPWWFFTFQLKPYSSMGYSFSDSTYADADKTLLYTEKYTGQGGLNKLSISTAFKIFKMFSVGATGSVLFGNLERSLSVSSTRSGYTINGVSSSAADFYTYVYNNNKHIIHGLQYDLGFRFEKSFRSRKDTLSNAFKISAGVYIGNKSTLKSRDELFLHKYQNYYTTTYNSASYVSSMSDTLVNDTLSDASITLPQGFGAGISMEIAERFTINADYQTQKWSDFSLPCEESVSHLRDSKYYGVGMQFVAAKYSSKYYKTINYRIGYHQQDTYLTMNGYGINEKGFTFGLGFPIKSLIFNISCDMGTRGTTEHNLYKEKYYLINFSVTAHDVWFVKRKFQ